MLVTVATIHAALSRRRRLLVLCCCLLLVGCGLLLARMNVGENAAAMLPDTGAVARDFKLLQQAPFAKRLAVSLSAAPGAGPGADELTQAARELAARLRALGPPLVSDAMAGPPREGGADLVQKMLLRLPGLATAKDMDAVDALVHPAAIAAALRQNLLLLQSPQSFAVETFVRLDPLQMRTLALEKLGAVNLLPRMRLHNGAFLSRDRRHALVIMATDVPLTDVAGAERLLAAVDQAMAGLPPGMEADVLGGHGYTTANARAIKQDLARILSLSLLGLGLLFGLMVRTWRVLFVLCIPGLAYLAGAAAAAGVYGTVSGITLGFGGVLMGISVDFGLHVFLALRRESAPTGAVLASVARPIGFAFLTTTAAFSIMLLSDLPGVRQLSVFSLAGLATALLASLFLLPQLPLGAAGAAPLGADFNGAPSTPPAPGRSRARWTLLVWLAFLLLCGLVGRSLFLQADLRALALMPPKMVQAEKDFRSTWGDARGQAMVFARGQTLQQALQRNESVHEQLRRLLPMTATSQENRLLSLAPLLPPESLQQQRIETWRSYWERRLPQLRTMLQREARRLGFAPGAFEPFFDFLQSRPPLMTASDLRDLGFGALLEMLARDVPGGFEVLTLLPDDPELLDRTPPAWSDGEGPVRLVSQTRFRQEMEQALQRDFSRYLLLAAAAVLALLLALFRRPRKVLAAAAPVLSALAALAAGMALMGQGLTIYGVLAAVLGMGLSVDYGIFMTLRAERDHASSTDRAVLLSGLSTVIGFGALAAAQHPALHSMGLAVLFALAGGLPAALFVTPALREVLR